MKMLGYEETPNRVILSQHYQKSLQSVFKFCVSSRKKLSAVEFFAIHIFSVTLRV